MCPITYIELCTRPAPLPIRRKPVAVLVEHLASLAETADIYITTASNEMDKYTRKLNEAFGLCACDVKTTLIHRISELAFNKHYDDFPSSGTCSLTV